MNHIRMDSLTERLQAIVAPRRGSGDAADMQLPRTRQDVVLEETGRRAQALTLSRRVTPIDTSVPARKDAGSPLSGKTLYGDGFDEPHEKQQDDVNEQESKPVVDEQESKPMVDDPTQEEDEWPMKYPIAPQHCRRWGKPETYVVFKFPGKDFNGLRG